LEPKIACIKSLLGITVKASSSHMSISRTTRKRKPRGGENWPRLSLQESGHVEGTGNHERRGRESASEKQNSGLVFTHPIPNQISLAGQGSAGNSWFVSLFQAQDGRRPAVKLCAARSSSKYFLAFPRSSYLRIFNKLDWCTWAEARCCGPF
jgi:hypothetical protein